MLLNRQSLSAVECASTEESRYALSAIHITKEHTEATNGHIAIRITHPEQDETKFPEVGQKPLDEGFEQGFIESADAKAILKAIPKMKSLKVLEQVHLGQNGGPHSLEATVTDLSSTRRFTLAKQDEYRFPNMDLVIPAKDKQRAVSFGFDGKLMMQLIKPLLTLADERSHCLVMTVYDQNSVVKIEAKCSETGQTGIGLLMPMRTDDNKQSDSKVSRYDEARRLVKGIEGFIEAVSKGAFTAAEGIDRIQQAIGDFKEAGKFDSEE